MKKNIASYLVLALPICVLLYITLSSKDTIDLSKYSTKGLELNYTVSQEPANTQEKDLALNDVNKLYSPYLGKSFVGFKEALAFKESRGDYSSVNALGYLGKYQFGAETLKIIGIHNPAAFLSNPALQERAFIANAERNKWILRRDIKNFVGKKINGVVITESGILAAAHLAGPGSVKHYLRSYGVQDHEDSFGTSVQYYIKKFSGYDMSFLKANKKAKATSM
jgi:hypothetical protein